MSWRAERPLVAAAGLGAQLAAGRDDVRGVPPTTVPTLAVVSASIRPSGIREIARAAATTALRPFSGEIRRARPAR